MFKIAIVGICLALVFISAGEGLIRYSAWRHRKKRNEQAKKDGFRVTRGD